MTYADVYDIMIEYQRNTNERKNMKTPQEVIAKLKDAENGIYSAAELESIWVPNEMLPERYHDNREGGSNLKRTNEIYDKEITPKIQNMREESVVIQDGKIMSDNPERLAVLNRYRDAVEADYVNFPDSVGEEDFYAENEYKLYRNQQAFASAIGLDLEEEDAI